MLPPPPDLTRHVLDLCRGAGFERTGIATVEPSRWAEELSRWLRAGKQGSMTWLGENLHVKNDPGRLLRGSRAIVMVAVHYAARGHTDPPTAHGHGRVARYARGRDYHRALKRRLHDVCDQLRASFPGHECRAFADIEPMPERELAARAGLGWVGKHTLVIDPRHGSWMVLGGFATTLPLAAPPTQTESRDHCGTCTRCIDACPTGCITPYSVDASRCISYLTIERRQPIDPTLHAAIGDWVFGCDVCQEVCPHNSGRPAGPFGAPIASNPSDVDPAAAASVEITGTRASLPLLEVLGWSAEDRSAALSGSVIKRATLVTLKRNAIVALANQARRAESPEVIDRLCAIADSPDEPELLRETARQSLARLGL